MAKKFLDADKLDCMANRLKSLSHPVRIEIIEMLQKNQKMTVTSIQHYLKIEQAATSNHLRILKDQQIVKSERSGKNKYYMIRENKMAEILEFIEKG
jgi:DNA-binding transcriptional ArsR family regulator